MNLLFCKHLLNELHMAVYKPGDFDLLSDDLLCEAVTQNDNLQSVGLVLKPGDLVRLAVSPSLISFYNMIRTLEPVEKTIPMYPEFPKRVMPMQIAQYRFRQMLRSSPDSEVVEQLEGKALHHWLPGFDDSEFEENDSDKCDCKVIKLVDEHGIEPEIIRILLDRMERLTNRELELLIESARDCSTDQLQGIKVRNRENVAPLFRAIMKENDSNTAIRTLKAICTDSEEVLRLAESYIRSRHYHLRTHEKRILVKLLENYSVSNFQNNLMKSRKTRERNLMVLNYLDYNRYSRSAEHREAVSALRNGDLLSWYSIAEELLQKRDPNVLSFLAQNPDHMVRMLNRLLSLGYSEREITAALVPQAEEISAQLLANIIGKLMGRKTYTKRELESQKTWLSYELTQRLEYISKLKDYEYERKRSDLFCRYDRYFRGKPSEIYSLRIRYCELKAESLRREADRVFFQEPEERARAESYAEFRRLQEEIAITQKKLRGLEHIKKGSKETSLLRNDDHAYETIGQELILSPEMICKRESELREQLLFLKKQIEREKESAKQRFAQESRLIEAENSALHAERLEEIRIWEHNYLEWIWQDYNRMDLEREREQEEKNCSYDVEMEKLWIQYNEQLHRKIDRIRAVYMMKEKKLEGTNQAALRMYKFDPVTVRILRRLLLEHFRKITTPLKGKKVFFQLEQFDLCNSSLEEENPAIDLYSIRHGIAYRIPSNTKIVRFFVYYDCDGYAFNLIVNGVTLNGDDFLPESYADLWDTGITYVGDTGRMVYFDIDLSAPVKRIDFTITVESWYCDEIIGFVPGFHLIQPCYAGIMPVKYLGQTIIDYDPSYCFFTHKLTQRTNMLPYGYFDVPNRYIRYTGSKNSSDWLHWQENTEDAEHFSLQDYLDCVFDGQNVQIAENEEQADVILTMGKSNQEKGISLIESNFFLEF